MADIKQIPNLERDELIAQAERMKRNFDAYVQLMAVDASMKKARYDALITAGFGSDEALMLIHD